MGFFPLHGHLLPWPFSAYRQDISPNTKACQIRHWLWQRKSSINEMKGCRTGCRNLLAFESQVEHRRKFQKSVVSSLCAHATVPSAPHDVWGPSLLTLTLKCTTGEAVACRILTDSTEPLWWMKTTGNAGCCCNTSKAGASLLPSNGHIRHGLQHLFSSYLRVTPCGTRTKRQDYGLPRDLAVSIDFHPVPIKRWWHWVREINTAIDCL